MSITFRELKARAVELGIKSTGKGITADYLREKIFEAEISAESKQSVPNEEDNINNMTKVKKIVKPSKEVKKIIGKKKSYQTLFRERDPDYFNSVKKLVPKMPDIRGFRSKEAINTIKKWDNESRYEYLLADFNTLEHSKELGQQSDIDFVEMLNKLSDVSIGKWRPYDKLESNLLKEKFDINGFINLYPAMSWILAMTNPTFRFWAMIVAKPNYQEWIREYKEVIESERVVLSEYITSDELMELWLTPLEDEISDDTTYPGSDLIDQASAFKNGVLLRYLAKKFSEVHTTSIFKFIEGGDITAFDIALKKENSFGKKLRQPDDSTYLDSAFESSNVDMLNYLEKIRGSRFDASELRTYQIASALSQNNLNIIKWAEERGYQINISNLESSITLPNIKRESIDYILSKLNSPKVLFEEINHTVRYEEYQRATPFAISVNNPDSLLYLIHTYRIYITDKDWNDALVFIHREYNRNLKDNIGTNDELVKSLQILLREHSYPKYLIEKYELE